MNSAQVKRPKLFEHKPVSVRSDIFLHGLDADSFTRPSVGEARPMVIVEFNPEENEVTGKVYDAESLLKYAPQHCDAHRDGSVRGTVSRLLRELAAKVAADPSF